MLEPLITDNIELTDINNRLLERARVELQVLRLDLHCPKYSGNKYFKLKYNLIEARRRGAKQLRTFGGAYSNHLHAVALAGHEHGFSTVAVLRGEPQRTLNATLADAVAAGMHLHYVSRSEYRQRSCEEYQRQLLIKFPGSYLIPEGGGNLLGVKGAMEIADIIQDVSGCCELLALPCGTGSTLAGVASRLLATSGRTEEDRVSGQRSNIAQVLGVAVLKNAYFLENDVEHYFNQIAASNSDDGEVSSNENCVNHKNWTIHYDGHCGGYAKITAGLAHFINSFERQYGIPLEPVYSGKLFFALFKLISRGAIKNKRIVAIHTGGMQGLRGMKTALDAALKKPRDEEIESLLALM